MFQIATFLYEPLLGIHNILRWLVVLGALLAFGGALLGLARKSSWGGGDDRAGLFFTSMMDLQLLVGLLLYFLVSPIVFTASQDFGASMGQSALRFFAVEHLALMLVAVVTAHIGRAASKKALESRLRFKRAAIWYGITIVLVLVSIPWPFTMGRPLLPFYWF